MRLSGKTVIEQQFGNGKSLTADFVLPEIEATVRDKAYDVIWEKAYLCPCKSESTPGHLQTCQNCGGSGWFFANPTKTRFLISGIAADGKLKEAALREWGLIEGGSVKITALNENKLSYMDRIIVLDATAEHNQILYPKLTDDQVNIFAFTQYNIESIDFLGLFESEDLKLKRLVETTDYTYQDNIITLDANYTDLSSPTISIRYVHRPVFHIIDILRESMTSTKGQYAQQQEKLVMPVHAIARRAHLIKDAENFNGDRLLDNSWLPIPCETPDMTKFQRQLQHTTVSDIWDMLTDNQKTELQTYY